MRSRELVLAMALALAVPPALPADAPTRQQVEQAAATVRQHPDLPGKRKEKTLRLRKTDDKKETRQNSSWAWMRDLARWLAETARVLIWLAGIVLVALLAVGIRRWALVRRGLAHDHGHAAPSHVQSLDIRPESLPEDVGRAAALLWQRGEHRAALSLLYRGALSRLVHAHAVPIAAASTEGECVALATQRLDVQRSAFFARLVGAWQLAVYGARLPETGQALALCSEFDLHLPATPQGAGAA